LAVEVAVATTVPILKLGLLVTVPFATPICCIVLVVVTFIRLVMPVVLPPRWVFLRSQLVRDAEVQIWLTILPDKFGLDVRESDDRDCGREDGGVVYLLLVRYLTRVSYDNEVDRQAYSVFRVVRPEKEGIVPARLL
jgi:uncharacterized membrane protein YqaE (UPF0057 family)